MAGVIVSMVLNGFVIACDWKIDEFANLSDSFDSQPSLARTWLTCQPSPCQTAHHDVPNVLEALNSCKLLRFKTLQTIKSEKEQVYNRFQIT